MVNQSRIHKTVPVVSLRTSVDSNCAAQAKLRNEISLLEIGPQKSAAQEQLLILGTDLIALNVEIRLRLLQNVGNA